MTADGLDTLLAGATVACETVRGQRGPEVSRILTIDFSTVAPRPASFVRPPAGGEIAAGTGAAQTDASILGRRVRALVKWYDPAKGYGFLEPEDGSADLFCHLTAVHEAGQDTLPQGAAVACSIV